MKRIFDKIVGCLNGIGADEYKHFAVGTAVAAIVLLAVTFFVPKWLALAASVVAVSAAAVGKELTDDKADLRDLAATLGGGVVVWLPFLVAILIV